MSCLSGPVARCLAFGALAVALALPSLTIAQTSDEGHLAFSIEGGAVQGSLDLGAPFVRSLASAKGRSPWVGVFLASLGSGPLTIDERRCSLRPTGLVEAGDRVELKFLGTCPPGGGELRWQLPFLARAPPQFRLRIHAERDGVSEDRSLGPGDETLAIDGSTPHGFAQFVRFGLAYLGVWPTAWRGQGGPRLPDGLDQMLLLLALLLGAGSRAPASGGRPDFGKLRALVFGFYVAQSVTLGLAAFGVVRLPARLTESAIALSIAWVAAWALFEKQRWPRWSLAAAFGLVHGVGLAATLAALSLPRPRLPGAVIGFDVGLGLGAAVLVAVAAPVLALLFRWPFFRRLGAPAFGSALLTASLVWFVKRAFP